MSRIGKIVTESKTVTLKMTKEYRTTEDALRDCLDIGKTGWKLNRGYYLGSAEGLLYVAHYEMEEVTSGS